MNLLKDYFLQKEANNWFNRNLKTISDKNFYDDLYSKEIISFLKKNNFKSQKLLDIGAANGMRLKFISEKVSRKNISRKNKFWLGLP